MAKRKKIPLSFYLREDVIQIARELIGKIIITNWHGIITSARIVEVEAYEGVIDRASHAYGGRRTNRTEIMYAEGGAAYIYLCYGIHQMFNIVTHAEGIPHAILIRSAEPVKGVAEMLKRTGKPVADKSLTRGPGNVGKALGFHTSQTGMLLNTPKLYLEDDGFTYPAEAIASSARIGVAYAGEDALLPYRFYVKGNPYVSGRPN